MYTIYITNAAYLTNMGGYFLTGECGHRRGGGGLGKKRGKGIRKVNGKN